MKKVLVVATLTLVGLIAGVGNQPVNAQDYTYLRSTSGSTLTLSTDATRTYSTDNVVVYDFSKTYLQNTSGENLTFSTDPTYTTRITSPSVYTYLQDPSAGTLTISYDPTNTTYVRYPTNISVGVSPTGNISIGTTPITTIISNDTTNSPVTIQPTTPQFDVPSNVTEPDDFVNLPSISGSLSVNDEYIVYLNYGDDATFKWESNGTSSCSVDPIGQSDTEGQYVLQDITSNMSVMLHCEAAPGFENYQIYPTWLARVEVRVLPPTFDYLKNYLSDMQPNSNKKVNLNSTTNFIDQAQRSYDSGRIDMAQSFLEKSVNSLKQQASRGSFSAAEVTQYENAANYLAKTLSVSVVIAPDGCSVTATGPAGLILEYGANELMRRGWGGQVTIPESGTITELIYATSGWTATGEVLDSDGLIYARDTKEVTHDDCPTPPVVHDPDMYNGYPEIWATPETGTVLDDWGYYNRTPESYVAFRVADSGRVFPADYGDASEWLAKAIADGYVVEIPQAGDVAVNTSTDGMVPIAQYVESVGEQGNVQMTTFSGSFGGSGGTVEGFSSYMKYIRFP